MIKLNHQKLVRSAERFGIDRIARMIGSWTGLAVLTYHRIGNAEDCEFDRGVFSVTKDVFASQMKFLSQNFEIVSINDVLTSEADAFARKQAVLITFDDGYVDNYVNAFPILRQFKIPALFFVTTGFLDNQQISWWDEIAWMTRKSSRGLEQRDLPEKIEHYLEQYYQLSGDQCEPFLNSLAEELGVNRFGSKRFDDWINWEMAREMSNEGMSFGGHTVTHPILTKTTRCWEFELSEGKQRIEHELGKPVDVFSYPVGTTESLNESLKVTVAKHYRMAFSCFGGLNHPCKGDGWNRYEMRRWPIWGSMKQFRRTITWPQLHV